MKLTSWITIKIPIGKVARNVCIPNQVVSRARYPFPYPVECARTDSPLQRKLVGSEYSKIYCFLVGVRCIYCIYIFKIRACAGGRAGRNKTSVSPSSTRLKCETPDLQPMRLSPKIVNMKGFKSHTRPFVKGFHLSRGGRFDPSICALVERAHCYFKCFAFSRVLCNMFTTVSKILADDKGNARSL